MRKNMLLWIIGCVGFYAALLPAVAQTPDANAAAAAARAKQAEINQRNEAAAAKLRADQAALNRRNEEAARARNAAAARTGTQSAPSKPATPPLAGAAPAPRNTPPARRQLESTQRDPNHNFDGRKPLPGPVRADPANKPSQVGTPTTVFKPKPVPSTGTDVARMRTNPPPSPTVTRSTTPVTTSAVRPPSPPAAAARPAPAVVAKPAPVAAKPAPVATKPAEEKKK